MGSKSIPALKGMARAIAVKIGGRNAICRTCGLEPALFVRGLILGMEWAATPKRNEARRFWGLRASVRGAM